MASGRVLLFGDQMLDSVPILQKLVDRSRRSPLLRRFLREAFDVVQHEAGKLSQDEARAFIESETLLTMAEENAKLKHPDEIVNTTVMCIARIAELISFAESDSSILNSQENTTCVGLCMGLLPAAVSAVSRDTSEVLRYGLEMTAISFRLAHEVVIRSSRIESDPGTWSYTLIGMNAEQARKALDQFNKSEKLPTHKRVFVSVAASKWITISGPPSTLSKLWSSSNAAAKAPRLELPAGATVHSPHLPPFDLAKILSSPTSFLDTSIKRGVRVISTWQGKAYDASNLRDMLKAMVLDIDQNQLNMISTIQQTVTGLKGVPEVQLLVIGPTSHAASFHSALQAEKINTTIIENPESLPSTDSTREGSGLVAIVGFSGRFPGSEDIYKFWQSLLNGQDAHSEIPKSRFDLKEHFDPSGTGRNKTGTPYGCFIDNPGLFDGRLFNVSPREALQIDPVQRLLLMATFEALEMSGYGQKSPSTVDKRMATWMAQVTDDWRAVNECEGVDIYYIPGISRAFTSGRINYHFKWEGETHNDDTACAATATIISSACDALLGRTCDTAVAGGGSILTAPRDYAGLSKGGFLSPTGNCKTFREDADGYCRGEGIGVVVLKRLEDAIADKDNIQAVLRGWGRNYSAHASSITQPHADTQRYLYKRVLQQASLHPHDIQYVEMHGTGTQPGDKNEMDSVLSVLGKDRKKENPLTVGAVKANVGHGESVAALTSLVKVLMMFRERTIPPQPGSPLKLNPNYPPLKALNVIIAQEQLRFEPPKGGDGKRRVLLNSFDASGGNTCLLLEDAPSRAPQQQQDPRTHQVVVCSARTSKSLTENQRRLQEYISENPQVNISDLAYTLTARRTHHTMKKAYSVMSAHDLAKQLATDLSKDSKPSASAKQAPTVFTFTGQGSVHPGMGKQLFESCPPFQSLLLTYQNICESLGLPEILELITNANAELKSMSTAQIQLALTCLEIALANTWISWGVKPSLLIGHSLGEYAALCVSGVLSITDTLYLVGKRSTLLQERCEPGAYAMLSIGASVERLQEVRTKDQFKSCQVACINAPNKTVVSGPIKELQDFKDHLDSAGVRGTFLEITYGFHSAQVEPILKDFESSARSVHFAKPNIPIASTLEAGKIVQTQGTFSPQYLVRQAREPVAFVGALQACKSANVVNKDTLWLEIGPGAVNISMIRPTLDTQPAKLLPSLLSKEDQWKTITQAMAAAYSAQIPIYWTEYHKHHENALSLLELPFYAFDLKNYWASYTARNSESAPEPIAEPSRSKDSPFASTTTLHSLVEESIQSADDAGAVFSSAVFSTALSDPKLLAAIRGHVVDDTPLCSASIFCDMALAAARHLFTRVNPEETLPSMTIQDLEITHPLLAPDKDDNEDIMETTASKAPGNDWIVNLSFSARLGDSSSTHELATCKVRLGPIDHDQSAVQQVKSKMEALIAAATNGQHVRLPKPFIYKLFANLVKYDKRYHGMEDAYLNYEAKEAAASVRLPNLETDGIFVCNPYWADAALHIAGFMFNGNASKPDDVAYVATGIGSLCLLQDLKADVPYHSYTSFGDEEKGGLLKGDIHVFQEQELVAICSGAAFQKLNKRALRIVFGKAAPPTSNANKSAAGSPDSSATTSGIATPATTASTSPTEASGGDAGANITQKLLASVAAETGYGMEDIEPSTEFSDMGVDSLMSIAIVSAVKKQLRVELSASFFQDYPTVADVQTYFAEEEDEEDEEQSGDATPASDESSDLDQAESTSSVSDEPENEPDIKPTEPVKPAEPKVIVKGPEPAPEPEPANNINDYSSSVVLVQGRRTSKATPLFLIADGAGSAAAFIHLPAMPSGAKIYAMESPFLADPSKFTFSIPEVAKLYIAALREAQPQGPYLLGGWSAGAAFAYECARQLIDQGQRIAGLILIDMHVPKPLPDGAKPSASSIDDAGFNLGLQRPGQSFSPVTEKTKAHLLASVTALTAYKPIPMEPSKRPDNVFIVWAKRGLCERDGVAKEEQKDYDPDRNVLEDLGSGLKSWFWDKRTSFGPNGWDKLVGDVEILTVDGDHFSIVMPPLSRTLGQHLRRATEKSMASIK